MCPKHSILKLVKEGGGFIKFHDSNVNEYIIQLKRYTMNRKKLFVIIINIFSPTIENNVCFYTFLSSHVCNAVWYFKAVLK